MKYAILVGQHSQLCENRVSSSHSSQINSKLASHLPELPLNLSQTLQWILLPITTTNHKLHNLNASNLLSFNKES